MEGKNFFGGLALVLIVFISACMQTPTGQVPVNNSNAEDIICIPVSNLSEVVPSAPEVPTVTPDEFPGVPRKTYIEGELVKVTVSAKDADGDDISVKYSKPLDNKGEWQTKVGDAGKYLVTITATDGKAETSKQILLIIEPQNHPPVMTRINDVVVSEGQTITFLPEATDQDRDPITYTYTGWMTTPSYTTKFGDAGIHQVTITASDGKAQVSQSVQVTVTKGNRAPELKDMLPLSVTEGDIVIVKPEASDPDGDDVMFLFSEPLDRRGRWETKSGDAGTYTATVTATDGKTNSTKSVSIVVLSKNHPPVIEQRDIIVNVGETVRLSPKVTDQDGDEVKVTFAGWMEQATRVTNAGDVGTHIVTISATDGEATSNLNIKVTVNSPPEFTFE